MNIVLLSGGKGTRLEGMDLPKPLCMLKGKSLLFRVLEALPQECTNINIFYSYMLENVQFERTVIHSCASLDKQFQFTKIGMDTRGPVETAFVGLKKGKWNLNEGILFIDNDTVNSFTIDKIDKNCFCIGTSITSYKNKPYCFVRKNDENKIVEIKEKQQISNEYCTGLYYFPSISSFLELANELFESQQKKKEFFMSDLYLLALQKGLTVKSFLCGESITLGTQQDIKENIEKLTTYKTRYCFDIDNTILSYSSSFHNKDDIQPIPSMMKIIKKLHDEGNTIILHTARGMQSNHNNIGLVGKKSMLAVFEILEKYSIPYDEIYFGKPAADLYIDDKAWNPYTNASFSFPFFGIDGNSIEKGCSNNENTLVRNGNTLMKKGPQSSLEGEIYFYEMVAKTDLKSEFPTFIQKDSNDSFTMEYIEGNSVSRLFTNHCLTKIILEKVVYSIEKLHSHENIESEKIDKSLIYSNYMDKLKERVAHHPHYELPHIEKVVEIIEENLKKYFETFQITNIIHGDPWFDNMMYDKDNRIRLLDMKGKLGNVFSVQGDRLTDYAKIYQSILGFDFYLQKLNYYSDYENQCREWFSSLLSFPIDDPIFESVTACVILKTFYYFSDDSVIFPIYRSLSKMKLFSFLGSM